MPKSRQEIAADVASNFLPAKRNAVQTAAGIAEFYACLVRNRWYARLLPGEHSDIIRLAREASDLAAETEDRMQQAHALIANIRQSWAIPEGEFGDEDTPPRVAGLVADRTLAA